MDSLLLQARKASRDSKDCRKTMDVLRGLGFDEDAFSILHHQNGSRVVFYSYCEDVRFRDDGNNHRVHQRLTYVQLSCQSGAPPKGKSFEMLAEEAVRLIPPIA